MNSGSFKPRRPDNLLRIAVGRARRNHPEWASGWANMAV